MEVARLESKIKVIHLLGGEENVFKEGRRQGDFYLPTQ
jgi:hypothetical protein